MRTLVVAAFVLLATSVPIDPIGEADARPEPPTCVKEPCGPPTCVLGSDADCIVRIVCVTEPCKPERFP